MIQRPVTKTTIRLTRAVKVAAVSFAAITMLVMYFNLQQPEQALANTAGDYRSKTSGNWNTTSTWERYTGSAWVNATATPNNTNGVITILAGHVVTVTASVNLDQVIVATGATLRHNNGTLKIMDGTGTDIIVNGTLELNSQFTIDNNASQIVNGLLDKQSGGYTINSGGTVVVANGGIFRKAGGTQDTGINQYTIQNGGTYLHEDNGSNLPKATWDNGSNLLIKGVTNSTPGNLDQSFYNVTWDNPGQTNKRNLGANLQTVNGNLTIVSTGAGSIIFATNSNQGIIIGGDFIQQGGTVAFTETGNWTTTVTGNLNVTGGNIIFSDASGSNASGNAELIVNGNSSITNATVNLSQYTGSNSNMGTGKFTIKGNFDINNGTLLTVTSTGTGRGLLAFAGTTQQLFSKSGTMTGVIDVDVASNAILNLTNNIISGSGNFTLNSDAELRIGMPLGITTTSAAGNVQVTGTRTYSAMATYTFIGLANQVPGSGVPISIKKLCINTASTVTFPNSATITGTLEILNGVIDMGTNTLTVGESTASTGVIVRTNGVVYGKLRRWVSNTTGSTAFPVATNNGFKNVNINYTTAPVSGGTITTEFISTAPAGLGLPLMDGATQLLNVGDRGYWTITPANGLVGGVYALDLTAGGFTGIGDVSGLRVLTRLNAVSPWLLNGTHTAGTTVSSNAVARRAGVTLVQQFGVGGGSANPLPIDLISFDAALRGAKVKVTWKTMTETNNDFFTVERSVNGTEFESVGTVRGAGTTVHKQSYSFNDTNPLDGTTYYRLRQTDFDGKTKTFDIKVIKNSTAVTDEKMIIKSVWPNPFTDQFDMNIISPESGKATISLINMSGAIIRTEVLVLDNGNNQASFKDLNDLQSGYYVLRVAQGNHVASEKLMKR